MKFLITNHNASPAFQDPPKGYVFRKIGGYSVLLEEEGKPKEIERKYFFLEGYIKDHNKEINDLKGQEKSVVKALSGSWPLPEHISGSFSAVMVDKSSGIISLGTDLIGLYPLYYLNKEDEFYFSNSIILTGVVSGASPDRAGVAQRCLGPDFFNLGSRTILENCKRLLPGECRRYNQDGELVSVNFDNSLYQNISDPFQEHSLAKSYWQAYKEEVAFCLNESNKVNIALSGGIDSRLALGAIPEEKQIDSYTFGNKKNYESRIAARLAKAKGADFIVCDQPELYFPTPEMLRKYTFKTEGVELCSWLEITEKVQNKTKELLLLGELCEALPGRKISRFNSREFRKKNFLKYYLQNKDYQFEASTKEKFEIWKTGKKKQYEIYYIDRKLSELGFQEERESLINSLRSDLEEVFCRMEAQEVPYTELYEELFSWYTFTRMRLSKQLLTANSKFQAYSPAMSLKMLRLTSSLHPNLRLNYRFAKKVFKENKELKKLYRIPTNQAPFVPQNAPDLFKFLIWGMRSRADQFFIKRLMKAGDPNMRYRLLPSINWVKVYQHPLLEKHLDGYFKENHLGDAYTKGVKQQALQRKKLIQWPFANMNIINSAALNTELDLIERYRKQYEV